MNDYISPAERLRPPSRLEPQHPSWKEIWRKYSEEAIRFFGEVLLRYKLKCAAWEMESGARHQAEWRFVVLQCQDKLRALGVDPAEAPEDWTRMFEVWLLVAVVLGFALLGFLYSAYKGALLELIQKSL